MICEVCGNEFHKLQYGGEYQNICSSGCFDHKFWDLIVAEKDKHVIIGGKSYSVGAEDSKFPFRGHGGRKFRFKMIETGEVVTTTNLWYQGEIPESHKDKLPDTAVWVVEWREWNALI